MHCVMASALLAVAPLARAQMMNNGGTDMMGPDMQHGMMDGVRPLKSGTAGAQQRSSKEENEYHRVCASCHALPNPQVHTASQWPQVVSQMQQYISSYGMPQPDQQTLHDIEDYLEDHAAKR